MYVSKYKAYDSLVIFAKGNHAQCTKNSIVNSFLYISLLNITINQKAADKLPIIKPIKNGIFVKNDFFRRCNFLPNFTTVAEATNVAIETI
jgi:hypothetical protein